LGYSLFIALRPIQHHALLILEVSGSHHTR